MNKQRQHGNHSPCASQRDLQPGMGWLLRCALGATVILVVLCALWAFVHFLHQVPLVETPVLEKTAARGAVLTNMPDRSNAPLAQMGTEREKESAATQLNSAANDLLKSGNTAAAVLAYKKALELSPNDEDLHYNLGIAYMRLGDFTNAESQYRQALKLLPDYPEVHNNLGNLLLRTGRLTEAEEQFTEAVKQMPEYAQAHNNLGIVRQRQRMTNEAFLCFQKAVELDTNYWEARFNLAVSYLQRQDREKGIAELKEVLRVNPSAEIAQRMLQQALGQTKAPEP